MESRSRYSLDGQWNFWVDPEACLTAGSLDPTSARQIIIPAPWQAQFEDLRHYSGAAWYQRTVQLPASWFNNRCLILGIDAADYVTEAWLNGVKVGRHEGGYLPFEFDITSAAQPGENTLVIRVEDPPELFPEIPHGKQSWYGQISGIWQSIWLESRSPLYLSSLEIQPDLDTGKVKAIIHLAGAPASRFHLLARIVDADGQTAASLKMPLPFKNNQVILDLQVTSPCPWSPQQPTLYSLEVQLQNNHEMGDSLAKSFGFRKIEARDGKLYLNGKPLYLRAALDQDYYLDTIYTTPSTEFLEDQITKAKELGLNCLRCHIKVADPRYYAAADRLGMLVWTELPNWGILTSVSAERARAMYRDILERDGHHPSIIIWTIINEDWGTDLVNNPDHRAWLKDTYHWLKSLDPSRLVVDNSPCVPNFHVQTDIEDYHFYRGIPDHRRQWDGFIDTFAARSRFTFSPHEDADRTLTEPLIVSEFGNWGLPDADLLCDEQGRDPWWFESGLEWSDGVVYPHNVRDRFLKLGLDRIFHSWKAFIQATQQQQFLALKYQIESIRRKAEISGYVITELTDVHWECNGLLDMARNPKCFQRTLGSINSDTIIVPEWETVSYSTGDLIRVGLSIAHGNSEPLEGAHIHWHLTSRAELASRELGGIISTPRLSTGEVASLGVISVPAPQVLYPQNRRLQFELHGSDGTLLATNFLELALYPRRIGPPAGFDAQAFRLYVPDQNLASRLQYLGYTITTNLAEASAAVTAKANQELLNFAMQGGRLLILADRQAEPGEVIPDIRLAARTHTPWEGDWASTFTWVDRQGSFKRLPGGPLIDHSFDLIIPDFVLMGYKDWDFPTQVHAGLFVGWVQKPAALIGCRNYGNGKILVNTFRLGDELLGYDPTATTLMDALLVQLFTEDQQSAHSSEITLSSEPTME